MNGKQFVIISVSLTLLLLIAVAVLQIAIDPLYQYHIPSFGMKPDAFNERYQNPGVAKHFEYDNVIMGNSIFPYGSRQSLQGRVLARGNQPKNR